MVVEQVLAMTTYDVFVEMMITANQAQAIDAPATGSAKGAAISKAERLQAFLDDVQSMQVGSFDAMNSYLE